MIDQGGVLVVSSYTDFSSLAHLPRGTASKHFSLSSYRLDAEKGRLTLLAVSSDCTNPAFSRFEPTTNTLYTCTEFLKKNGEVVAYKINHATGALQLVGRSDAGGTSTCYITIDRTKRKMLLVNYWDSTVTTIPIHGKTFSPGPVLQRYAEVSATHRKELTDSHVDHSKNDASAIRERQSQPHLHAIVLDPETGCIALVPDLGMDCIRQFYYDTDAGTLSPACSYHSGPREGK